MAPANYRITNLAVEGFRGFTVPQSIPFDGRNVFIFGENGLGKSSIVEAIQWCLFGGADIQVRNSIYDKQECRVTLDLEGPKGKLTITRELRPGHPESDPRIKDARGKDVTLREVFPQLAKLRSTERTQVIFAAQHAGGRRTRPDISDFRKILYFYLKLEDVPDLIEQMAKLIEEQKEESDSVAKRVELIAEGFRDQRRHLHELIEDIRADPPWQDGASPTEAQTEQRIADFVREVASLLDHEFPSGLSSDDLLQKADEWLSLQSRDIGAFQIKLDQKSGRIEEIEALIPQVRAAETRLSNYRQRVQDSQARLSGLLSATSRRALVSEIECREAAQTKTAAILAIAESVAKLCEKYNLDACPACGTNLDRESLAEQASAQLQGRESVDGRAAQQLEDVRAKLRSLDEAAAEQEAAADELAEAQGDLDALMSKLVALAERPSEDITLADIESHVAKLRSDLALSRTKTDERGERQKLLSRRINDYKQELRYHRHRRKITEIDRQLGAGMETARRALRDREDFLHHVEELTLLIEAAFKKALDKAIPPLNELLSGVYRNLTRPRSFDLIRVYHDPKRIGHLELRVASKRRPGKDYPANVLNGQARRALHLLPYLVFSQFRRDLLELDLLLIDDPSESFDTSHVALLIAELRRTSDHAQLIVASHEQEKFSPHLADHFDQSDCAVILVNDFDPDSGPCIVRQQLAH